MNILAIDIGGTKTMAAIIDETGHIGARKRIETPAKLGPSTNIAAIKSACRQVLELSGRKPDIIGIGCGGPMDRKTGVLHDVPNLPGWKGLFLTQIFTDEFGAPGYLDHDATVAAMGEMMFGAGRGIDDFVYFTISTGIGGGIIADGKIYRGCGDNAGEFGHMKVSDDGPECPCGDRGCLESFSSGTSIAREARKALSDNRNSLIWDWIKSEDEVTAKMVADAARDGDELAKTVWETAMYHLGLGVTNVINCLNPRCVILGGGVTHAGEMLFSPVREVVSERAMAPLAKDVSIVPAQNGEDTGTLGAAALAIDEYGVF